MDGEGCTNEAGVDLGKLTVIYGSGELHSAEGCMLR